MMNLKEIKEVAAEITYLDWVLVVNAKNDVPYLQWQFNAPDNDNPTITMPQKGRKWQLSYHMIPQEIERTAYKALKTAISHERDENYRYKGVQIRHPHLDPDQLVEFMKTNPVVMREAETTAG